MRTQKPRRSPRWPLVALAAAAVGLLLPAVAWAGFNPPGDPFGSGGPAVRVVDDDIDRVEIRWIASFGGDGKVEVFDNPDGTGTPIDTKVSVAPANDHTISFNVGGVIKADTTYYFKVTHSDPNGNLPDLTNEPAPFPPFFTGAQAIGPVSVVPSTNRAEISWDANVIGSGRVEYGPTTAYGQTGDDAQNVTDHSITLTGLQPATTHYFRVCNRHTIDGDCLAEQTGSFTTLSTISGQFLEPLTQSTDPANPVVNTGKNGRVIPVKVQLDQGGTAITELNAPGPVTIAVSGLACGDSAGTDPVGAYADAGESSAGTNQFRYDALAQAWVYNLDTKALGLVSGNCYRVDVSVAGTQVTNSFVAFQPRK